MCHPSFYICGCEFDYKKKIYINFVPVCFPTFITLGVISLDHGF